MITGFKVLLQKECISMWLQNKEIFTKYPILS